MTKENSCLVESLKVFENKLDEERQKRIALEQYGRREMVEVCGIKAFEGEDCKELIFKVSQPVNTNIKMDNIEIAHRIKIDSIIVKFSDKPSRDKLFTKKVNLNGITTADVGLGGDKNSVFISESLGFETEIKQNCREFGFHYIMV